MAVKKATPAVPSSEVVDAYKSYLMKAALTLTAKDFAEGAAIPTDQVEKDILILENKIAQYKKFGFPCDKEEKQAEILKSYKTAVKGKSWPTAKQAMNSSLYYDKTHVESVKAQTPWMMPGSLIQTSTAAKSLSLRVGKTEVEQRFLMRMGMLSNCNVSFVRLMTSRLIEQFVLKCGKCDKNLGLSDVLLLVKENDLPAKIEEFCIAHRHDARVLEKEGRHFRED